MCNYIQTKMWIQLITFFIASIITGASADESRTALIASGCVAGAILVVTLAVLTTIFILRFKKLKEKQKLTLPRHEEVVANGFHRSYNNPSNSMSAILSENYKPDGRPTQSKSLTQLAAHPRHRPPVAFYTMRAHPGHPESMRNPGFSNYPIGQPVVFLDWNGEPLRTADDETYAPQINSHTNRSRRHRSKARSSGTRENRRSKSQPRIREPLDSGHRRHSSTDLPSVSAAPGDLIMQTRSGEPKIPMTNKKENLISEVKTTNKKESQEPEIQMRKSNKKEIKNPEIPMWNRTERYETEIPLWNTKEIYDSNNNRYKPHENENVIQTTSFITPATIIEHSTIPDNIGGNKYVADEGPYSITQLQTNSTIYPSAINATAKYHPARNDDVVDTTFRESEPVAIPQQDYPIDSPRQSAIMQPNGVVRELTHIDKVSVSSENVVETPWVDLPKLSTSENLYEDTTHFERKEMNVVTTTTTQIIDFTREKDHVAKEEIEVKSHRQNSSLTRPPSPPLNRSPTPPFDADSLIYYPKTLPLTKITDDVLSNINRVPTPPPDMSPVSDVTDTEYQEKVPKLPMFSSKEHKRRPPTPPPGLIRHDLDFNIDDIINMGKDTAQRTTTEVHHTSTSEKTHNMPPFMEELKLRQQSMEDDVRYSPPPSPPMKKFQSDKTKAKNWLHDALNADDEYSDAPPIPKSPQVHMAKRPSAVQFSEQSPEIIRRATSHDSDRQEENDYFSNDNWKDTELLNSPVTPIPPPPPPPPPPAPPLPPFLK